MQWRRWRAGLIGGAVLLGAWTLAVRALHPPDYILPPPWDVALFLFRNLATELRHLRTTALETVGALGMSAVGGVLLGVLVTRSRVLMKALMPLAVLANVAPKEAFIPLFVLWLGFSALPKMLAGFLISFFPVLIGTIVGLQGVPRELLFLADSMRCSRLRAFRHIYLPHALSSIMGGIKVAAPLSVVGVVVGEFLGSDRGLGYLMVYGTRHLDGPALYAAFLLLLLLGGLVFGALTLLEHVAVPWSAAARLQALEERVT